MNKIKTPLISFLCFVGAIVLNYFLSGIDSIGKIIALNYLFSFPLLLGSFILAVFALKEAHTKSRYSLKLFILTHILCFPGIFSGLFLCVFLIIYMAGM